jgi:hypothetical protein
MLPGDLHFSKGENTMKSVRMIFIPLLILGILALASFWVKQDITADPSEKASPVVVDASAYSDLQTAIDAVPETGGLIKLPPGDFELTRPLLITQENIRVEGAGAATHLINHS